MAKKVFKNKEEGIRFLKKRRRVVIGGIIGGIIVVAVAILVILYVMGYFEHIPKQSTLEIKDDGRVIFEEVHDIDDEEYDIRELKSFAQNQIEAYNAKKKDRYVRFKRIWQEDNRICLKTVYKDAKTYADFTGLFLYFGTIGEAKTNENYPMKETFVSVQDGSEVPAEDALKEDTDNLLILDQILDIKCPQTPLYYAGAELSVVDDGDVIRLSKPSSDEKEKTKADPDNPDDSAIKTYIILE